MTLLRNHDTKINTSVGSKVNTAPTSSQVSSASKHHTESVPSSAGNSTKAGMGSDRLPQGKLDSSRTG